MTYATNISRSNADLQTADSNAQPAIAEDVNHAADLIKRKLVRENNRPDRAIQFSNLYSRLLSQPVLNQKWAILYFLYQLGDSGIESPATRQHLESILSPPIANKAVVEDEEESEARIDADQRRAAGRNRTGRQYAVNSPAFNEAFSRDGLPRLPRPEEQDSDSNNSRALSSKERLPTRPSALRRSVEPSVEPEEAPQEQAARPDAPTEAQLLRDLPFTLQGLSSTNLFFSKATSLKLPPTLPVPIISLLHTLAEPSLLYKSLSDFVDSSEGGLVGQSLRSAIGVELRAYLGLVATLEGQIRRALTQLAESPGKQGLGKAGVTLKRCVVWTREATMGLRLMSMIVEQSKGESTHRCGHLSRLTESQTRKEASSFP